MSVQPDVAAAEQYCYLQTRGRVTGRIHEIEIWFALDGDTLYMLAGGRHRADWVRNLQKHPHVRVRLGTVTLEGRARLIEGDAAEPLARRLLAAKYQGWCEWQPLSQWARTSLPVAVQLGASDTVGSAVPSDDEQGDADARQT